jgi:hypothetical protein
MNGKPLSEKELDRSANRLSMIFAVLGFVFIFASLVSQVFFIAVFGVIFLVGSVIFNLYGRASAEHFLVRKRLKVAELVEDKKAIVWVWIVAFLTWAIMAIAYFSLSMVIYMVLDSVTAFYAFDAGGMAVISLTRDVTGWFLVIMTVGLIGWALINSSRKGEDTYPTY